MYAHLFGWKLDVPSHDLHFGTSWHVAREYQLLHGYSDIEGAYKAFEAEYRKFFPADTDSMYAPKNPSGALNALMTFAEKYERDLIDNRVVVIDGKPMTEISGRVPINDTRHIYYRMDSILERLEDERIFSWDHKTTSGKYINNRQWSEQFHLSIQNGTYTHCLYCLFPIERVLGVEFCGAGFEFLQRGSKNRPAGYYATLQRVPAFKTVEQMNVWLWNVNEIIDNIERETDKLFNCKEEDNVLQAFHLNPKSCMDYKGCPYHDFCLAWNNPLQRLEVPLGYKEEFWDPSEMQTTNKMDLKWSF